jgi:hypothetical protein
MNMEKQLSAVGYWLGLTCTVLAMIARLFIAISVNPFHLGAAGGPGVSSLTLFHAAGLFFLLAIASWCRTAKN